ncbi:MAG: hypothetical protein KJ927_07765 [Candidatus Eisenbacteria bacterium]|nr:hypothetical protein [Candidatus Eisenbacteria bacterium]MBU1948590.1 hypothetical protein [Candidatus Eisenbacteria bacterium]
MIPALEAILSRRKREFDTLAVRGHLTIGDDLFISVAVPAEVLEKSLDLVLGHALDAIKERPIREIRFVVEKEEHYCRVDVKDTGAGLPEEAWERIFEQSVPIDGVEIGENKRLHAARDVLAPYGGKVFIKHSIPDEETTIRIILPTLAGRTEAARVMENRPNFPHQRGGDVNHKEDF